MSSKNSSLTDFKRPAFVPSNYCDEYLALREKDAQKHSVLVAIMDTGVDPGAFGLASCPDGSKKVVDVIDCTGADDVVVKAVRPEDVTIYLPSLNRVVGLKAQHDQNEVNPRTDAENVSISPSSSEETVLTIDGYVNLFTEDGCKLYKGCRSFKSFVSKRKYDLFEDKYKKVIDSLVFNVLVYAKEDVVVCLIDYDGIERNFIVLNEYHRYQEYGSIPLRSYDSRDDDNLCMNFGFHLYESTELNEKICSLVFDTGSHATHVAGIIGGSFPDQTMNGVNPHCKILSLKIGDTRVDGMETSIALIRALHEIVRYDCHIVNYSYGEPVASDKGRFIEMLNEFTYKHNITFVTSAGNSGPCITTVGAPGVVTDRTINVGAYTNREYLKQLYFLSGNSFEEGAFEWSSRGPSMNDGMGVDVLATGCALTSHPRWNSSNLKMCNGTSMAAPNATGFLSLILSTFDQPASYPHTFWLKRYAENTCSSLKPFEGFCQGHGLLGQRYVDPSYFTSVRTPNYYYEIVVNEDSNKKGVLNFDIDPTVGHHTNVGADTDNYHTDNGSDTSDNSDNSSDDDDTIDTEGAVFYNIELKLLPLPGKYGSGFKPNEAFHTIQVEGSDVGAVNSMIIVHPGCKVLRVAIPSHTMISDYIKFTEVSETGTQRYAQSVPFNRFVCAPISRNDILDYRSLTVSPGYVHTMYLMPSCNALKIKMDGKINHRLCVDVIQVYSGIGYNKRHSEKVFTKKNTENLKEIAFLANVVPNAPTQVCIYTSWNAPRSETVSLSVIGQHKEVSLNKHLYEMNEQPTLTVNRHLEDTDKDSFKTNLSLTNVVTKYYPSKAELTEPDARYVDKDGKRLKLLRIFYKINSHPKCSYYVNTNDRVYDSKLYMSSCIHGFYHEKRVFFANYVPKTYDKSLDTVVIEMMDSDESVLRECASSLVLTASRPPSKQIETSLTLKRGLNLIEIPTKEVLKLENVYNGDYLQFCVLNEMFLVMYKKPVQIKQNKRMKMTVEESEKEENKEDLYIKELKQHLTNFDHVKRFFNRATRTETFKNIPVPTYASQTLSSNALAVDVIENSLSFVDPDCVNVGNVVNIHKKMMDATMEERNQHEFVGTLCFEKDNGNEEEEKRFSKRIRLTYDHFGEQKLLKTPPYIVIDLANSIREKPEDLDDLDNKLKIISLMEDEMNYWNNCKVEDFNKLRRTVVNCARVSPSGDDKQDTQKLDRLVGVKRRCDLMDESDERVF
ncbi:peptidase [Yasminevirus sp. GU-2018]|uniref:Peptidase n=1 Tax=Yasminevirus sp. GU-2018 TaxID=2420051 RepID=A0A5K0U9X2_9VIRU|nr:peptidase [Yasminevirus sp. GU-2018]